MLDNEASTVMVAEQALGHRVEIILAGHVLNRLEPVPDQEGPPFHYRLSRAMLDRAASIVFELPATLQELQNRTITITVDLAKDRHWLPLVAFSVTREDGAAVTIGDPSTDQDRLVRDVASGLRSQGWTAKEAERDAKEAYQPRIGFDEVLRRALRSGIRR